MRRELDNAGDARFLPRFSLLTGEHAAALGEADRGARAVEGRMGERRADGDDASHSHGCIRRSPARLSTAHERVIDYDRRLARRQ